MLSAVFLLPTGAEGVVHRSGPTCRFAMSASTVFVEGSVAQPSIPTFAGDRSRDFAAASGENPPAVRACQIQHADAALSFASCRFLETDRPTGRLARATGHMRSSAPGGNGLPARLRVICLAESASSSNPLMGLWRCSHSNLSPALQRVTGLMPSCSGWEMVKTRERHDDSHRSDAGAAPCLRFRTVRGERQLLGPPNAF